MKIGIISDIHEHVDQLRTALESLAIQRVDQIVILGDVFETGEKIGETCRLLADAKAIGVWGNHDFAFCVDPDEEFRARYGDCVMEFMGTLQPRLEIAGCHFSHIEPWLDPTRIEDLWYNDGLPESPARLEQIFDSVSSSILFAGHYHRWLLATPRGRISWKGTTPIQLTGDRFFVVVNALFNGSFAILDTDNRELIPLSTGS